MKQIEWIKHKQVQPYIVQFTANIGSAFLETFVLFLHRDRTTNISVYVLKDNKLNYISDGELDYGLDDLFPLDTLAEIQLQEEASKIVSFIYQNKEYDDLDR